MKQLAGARDKDTANIRKNCLKLSTISTTMWSAKKHHSISREFDRFPMFKMTGSRRIACYEGLQDIYQQEHHYGVDSTYMFDKDTPKTVCEEDDRSTFGLGTTFIREIHA